MARRRRILTIVSWLTIVSLLPISWDGLPGLDMLDMLDITRLTQSPLAHLPALVARLARAEVGDVPAPHVKQPNAFPAEQTVVQRPGPKAFSQTPDPAERKPEFDFSEAEQKGPGVRARRELPGEPLTEIGIHLQGVGGRRARIQDGKRVFDVPSSRADMDAEATLASQLLAQPASTPRAQPTARTSASTPTVRTATPVPTATTSPTRGATATATSTPVATASPSTRGTASPTAPADPATPGGNRYGARLEIVLEPTADGRGMKETVRLYERPRTNVLAYDLDLHGLTPRARSDGGLDLLDHLETPAFLVPAPTLQDARGRAGTAAFRLVGDQKLEVVLDQGTLDSGALPLEVDPTVIASDANLLPNAPAPWQRQSVVANDGTQAFFYYDSTPTAPGIYLLTSSNNFASTSGPSAVLASLGAGGFSVEIDRATNTIYLALSGSISGQNRLALYPLTYSGGTHTWTLGTRIDLATHATNSWSGATVVIEEPKAPATTRYLWVGADQQAGTNYTFEARATDLSSLGGTPTWTTTNPGFSTASVARYGSLLAIDGGVVAFARDGTVQQSDTFARDCSPSACWRGTHTISTKMAAGNGKEYSTVATPDFNQDGTAPLVPVIAFSPSTGGTNRQAIEYSVVRTGTTSWNSEGTAAGSDDMYPQLTTDGTSFYLFRLKKNSSSNWEIRGQRVKLAVGSLDEDPDRTWLTEALSGDRKLQWLTVPRALGSEILPFYYIRDKSPDQLVYDVKRLDLFGDRSLWSYQPVDLPGAGTLKVNLANGNLHYEMTDANVPSRTWNDVIRRVYDSQNTSAYLMGPGWTGSFSPHLEFVGDKQINFWADDGAKYIYLKDPNTGAWYPELGMHTMLEKPNTSSSKVWRLTDLYGNRLLFNANGQPTYKRNGETTDSSDSFWTWSYTSGVLSNIQGVTGRNQAFSVSGGKIDQIKLLKPSFSAGSCTDTTSTDNCYVYKYEYDGNGRLTAATLIYNSVAYTGGVSGEQIRIEYGYESWPSTRLTSVKTPEGNVYSITYDAQGRVASIDLPPPASGQSATCGLTHCWQFAWEPGLGQVTVSDPRGKSWAYKTLGSGQVYERTDPLGHTVKRIWTAEQNLHSHTDPFDETTTFEYDTNANRTKITNRQGRETQFTYYSNNRRQSKEDARTNLTTYDYDTNGDINHVTDALTNSVDHDFNSVRQLTSVSDARNNYTDYTYDAHGQVATESRPDGSKTSYTRDTWGRVTETRVGGTSASNDDQGTETTYDDLGRVTKLRIRMSASPTTNNDTIDLITQSTYNRDGQLLSATDPMNGVTDYTVDHRGRVITTVMPGATAAERPCTTTEYLQNGLVWKQHVATARGSGSGCPGTSWSDTEFEYDDAGRRTREKKTGLTTSEYAGGEIVTQWAYDDAGRMTTITDPNGHETRFEYDEEGRKTKEERAVTLAGQSGPGCHGINGAFCTAKRWTYDEVGNVTREYQGVGTASSQAEVSRGFNWNPVNLLEELEDELGYVTSYTYDEDGHRLTETVPIDASTSSTTTWTYDEVGRTLTETKTAGAQTITTTYTYDKLGNRATHEDPKNQTTTYHYDKDSRLDQVTDALSHASSFSYDKNGNRLTITDPENHTQTFTFDANSRLTSEQTPSAYACTPTCSTTARTASTTYTLDGLQATATDFSGVTKTLGYDSARRLKTIDYSDSTPDVGYAYDKIGNRASMSESGSTATTYTYDELNRRTGETRSSRTVAYGYDRRDNTTITYPDSKVVTQTFDAAGRLQDVDDWRGSSTGRTAYSYDRAGRIQTRTLPSNAYTSWSYDTANRLTQVEHKASAGGSVLGRFSYTYDLAGNRLTQASYDGSTTKTQTFDYDALHRLTSEIPDTGQSAITYGYDKAGNRTSRSTGETYSHDADNRLLEIKLSGVSQTTFEYDANGSTTLKKTVASGDETKYTYDGARRLTDVSTRPSGGSFTSQAGFAYDGDGARFSKTVGTVTTNYVNDTRSLTRVVQEILSTDVTHPISYVPNIAQFNEALASGSQWAYFHQDAQNTRLLSDASAASSKRWDYDPFGNTRSQSGSAASDFQFAGEQNDSETGLVNLRARYYAPDLGRLLSRDSLIGHARFPQSYNRYAYVLNNPIRLFDPSGYTEAGDCTGSDDLNCSHEFEDDGYHALASGSLGDETSSSVASPQSTVGQSAENHSNNSAPSIEHEFDQISSTSQSESGAGSFQSVDLCNAFGAGYLYPLPTWCPGAKTQQAKDIRPKTSTLTPCPGEGEVFWWHVWDFFTVIAHGPEGGDDCHINVQARKRSLRRDIINWHIYWFDNSFIASDQPLTMALPSAPDLAAAAVVDDVRNRIYDEYGDSTPMDVWLRLEFLIEPLADHMVKLQGHPSNGPPGAK